MAIPRISEPKKKKAKKYMVTRFLLLLRIGQKDKKKEEALSAFGEVRTRDLPLTKRAPSPLGHKSKANHNNRLECSEHDEQLDVSIMHSDAIFFPNFN